MKLTNSVKKGSIVATVALGLTVFSPVTANVTYAETSTNAEVASQQLVDALQALNIGEIDYLYAHIQSISLSDAELNQINGNTERAKQILSGVSVDNMENAQQAEILRLFNENLELLQLQAVIVDNDGNKINPLEYEPGTTGLKIQLSDLDGNVLATANPTLDYLNPEVLTSKVNALDSAVEAKVTLEEGDEFVPMPSAELPNTATDYPDYILLGSLLILLGGAALVPAGRMVRRTN